MGEVALTKDTYASERELRESSIRFLGENAAALIHELRSPLMGISAQLQLMQVKAEQRGEDAEAFAQMIARVTELSRLCDHMMSMVKGGGTCDRRSSVDMSEVCNDAVMLLQAAAISRGVRLKTELPDAPVTVRGDEDLLRRLLINLISNAMQALESYRDDGTVTVTLEKERGEARLTVKDDGPGMDAEVIGRIFDSGFTTKEKGGGIGLPICAEIIRQHDGDLVVFSRKDVGTRFVVSLPLAAEKK